jgi:hypothetical protein
MPALFLEVKQQVREVNGLSQFNIDVKNEYSYPPTLPIFLQILERKKFVCEFYQSSYFQEIVINFL